MAVTNHREPKKHFEGFRLNGVKESVNQIREGVWIAIVGELWYQKNRRIFRGGRLDHSETFTMAHMKVWSWVLNP